MSPGIKRIELVPHNIDDSPVSEENIGKRCNLSGKVTPVDESLIDYDRFTVRQCPTAGCNAVDIDFHLA